MRKLLFRYIQLVFLYIHSWWKNNFVRDGYVENWCKWHFHNWNKRFDASGQKSALSCLSGIRSSKFFKSMYSIPGSSKSQNDGVEEFFFWFYQLFASYWYFILLLASYWYFILSIWHLIDISFCFSLLYLLFCFSIYRNNEMWKCRTYVFNSLYRF